MEEIGPVGHIFVIYLFPLAISGQTEWCSFILICGFLLKFFKHIVEEENRSLPILKLELKINYT